MDAVRTMIVAAVRGIVLVAGMIAFGAILAAILLTITDIVLRSASQLSMPFTGYRQTWAIPGLIDLTQLLMMIAAAMAIPVAFHGRAHISVDLLDQVLPREVRRFASVIAALLAITLLGACTWYGFSEMLSQRDMNTISSTLGIPYLVYWAPLLTGFVLSVIVIVSDILWAPPQDISDNHSAGGGHV